MNTIKTTILLYVTALTGPVFSAPQAVSEVVETAALPHSMSTFTSTPTAQPLVHDAVDGTRPTGVAQAAGDSTRLKERMDKPPEHLTIQIINSYGECQIKEQGSLTSGKLKYGCSDTKPRADFDDRS